MRLLKNFTILFFKRSAVCVAFTLLLLLASYGWLNCNYTLAIEEPFFSWQSKIKNDFLGSFFRAPEDIKAITLVDMSSVKQLVPDPNGSGDLVITDQHKLALLLTLLAQNGNHHRFIICDILVDSAVVDPSVVYSGAKGLKRILFPVSADSSQRQVPQAVVSYYTAGGIFFSDHFVKYDYWEGNQKGLPLRMEEMLTGKSFSKSAIGLLSDGDRTCLKNTLVDDEFHRLGGSDYLNANLLPGNEFINALKRGDAGYYDRYCRDKYILIGDFKSDLHDTALGRIPGPLVLMDLFLTLHLNHTQIKWYWILYMFLTLPWLFGYLFYRNGHRVFRKIKDLTDSPIGKLFSESFLITAYVFLISFLSYAIFNKPLEIVVLLTLIGTFGLCSAAISIIRYAKPRPVKVKQTNKSKASSKSGGKIRQPKK